MIDIARGYITIQGKEEEIKKFEVWFQTPFGLLEARIDAVNRCLGNDMDPTQCIRPVSVAVSESSYEVCGN